MTNNEAKSNPLPETDSYRASHLERGATYDTTLAALPFDSYMAQFEDAYLQKVLPLLFPNGCHRYLDFACGTARITSTVAKFCEESVGIDISASMLAEARVKCPAARFIEADITRDSIDAGQFDLVTSFRFFGNADQDLRTAVLRALHRQMRSNALLIVNSHRNPHSLATLINIATGGSTDGMDLNYYKLKQLFRSCGFEIVSSRPVGAWMFRHSMLVSADFQSKSAKRWESIFSSSLLSPIAPDSVLVLRRID